MPECGFKELSEEQAKRLVSHYSCPAGKRPFLVRAVYARDGVGAFRVERRANSLIVLWGSILGFDHRDHTGQSALVVNLDSAPVVIYNQLSTIEL
jgi:hypothetical protein